MALHSRQLTLLPPDQQGTVSARTWAMAALAVLVVLGIAAFATFRHAAANTGEIRTADPYASSLPITGVALSEATNGTGGKATYVDGTIANNGGKVLTGALVQVTFWTADGTTPHRETLPLALVRTREPYVDLQPVSASPIAPGEQRDFRLIFESVPATWDVKPPTIQVVHTELK